jgi:hypothetical protein
LLLSAVPFIEYSIAPDIMGRDSLVGVANRYGLNGPGVESRWGARFSAPVQTGPGAYSAFYTRVPGLCRQYSVDHSPPSNADVKGRVELYLYAPFGPSWPVLR